MREIGCEYLFYEFEKLYFIYQIYNFLLPRSLREFEKLFVNLKQVLLVYQSNDFLEREIERRESAITVKRDRQFRIDNRIHSSWKIRDPPLVRIATSVGDASSRGV